MSRLRAILLRCYAIAPLLWLECLIVGHEEEPDLGDSSDRHGE